MSRIVMAIGLCALLVAPLEAQEKQTLTLEAEISLHASADATSEVKATLAAGTVVEVISELDAWFAVETPDGVVGWLSKATLEGRGPAPEATPPAPRSTPTPPPPPTERAGATPPPPPRPDAPPARRPGATPSSGPSTQNSNTTTWDDQGGLYGTGGWGRLAISSTDGTPGGELAFATMIGERIEWNGRVGFDYRTEGLVAGADIVPFNDPAFTTSVQDDDPVSSLAIGGGLSYYLLEPTVTAPIGVHLGATGEYRDFFSKTHFGVVGYHTIMVGGEGGVFYRRQAGGVIRGAVQVGQLRYTYSDQEHSENVVNLLVGVEPKIGGIILSAFFIRRNNENMLQAGLTFR